MSISKLRLRKLLGSLRKGSFIILYLARGIKNIIKEFNGPITSIRKID